MKTLGPRHSTISPDPQSAARQNSENARDVTLALQSKLTASGVTVERYTAVGSTAARIPLGASERPFGVLLIGAAEVYGQGAVVAALNTPGMAWDATTQSVNAYEPSGLVADTVYQLRFILVEV